MSFEKLHIYTQHGHTYTFYNGRIVTNNESVLEFEYEAQSDGSDKTGVFSKQVIAGYSYLGA